MYGGPVHQGAGRPTLMAGRRRPAPIADGAPVPRNAQNRPGRWRSGTGSARSAGWRGRPTARSATVVVPTWCAWRGGRPIFRPREAPPWSPRCESRGVERPAVPRLSAARRRRVFSRRAQWGIRDERDRRGIGNRARGRTVGWEDGGGRIGTGQKVRTRWMRRAALPRGPCGKGANEAGALCGSARDWRT